MLMQAISHGGCRDTIKNPTLKVDWEKGQEALLLQGIELCPHRACFLGLTLYRLSCPAPCFSYTQQVQVTCASIERLGKITDGGWEVCEDSPYKPAAPCLVYSFGLVWVTSSVCVCVCVREREGETDTQRELQQKQDYVRNNNTTVSHKKEETQTHTYTHLQTAAKNNNKNKTRNNNRRRREKQQLQQKQSF